MYCDRGRRVPQPLQSFRFLGSIKGGAVGGVVGHLVGHHAVADDAIGSAVGHHQAKVK
jgi:hypothetical protein